MIAADDSALEQRPERFDGLRMNRTDNVNVIGVLNGIVSESELAELAVACMLVGRDQCCFSRDGALNEVGLRVVTNAVQRLTDYVSFAGDSADDRDFLGCGLALAEPLIPVLVDFLAADEGLVNFDYSAVTAEWRG